MTVELEQRIAQLEAELEAALADRDLALADALYWQEQAWELEDQLANGG